MADPLHWVTVALVVLAVGVQSVVPPLPPDPWHWSTVTPDVAVPARTVLSTVTLHVTSLPPPVTMPLHWSTEVTSWLDGATVVVQPEGGSTPAAAKQAVAVTVELVTPWAVTVLSMVKVQVTS
ncbi:MAG: hypothetical protein ACYCU7_03295 [Acidimicrobiales bacterium]